MLGYLESRPLKWPVNSYINYIKRRGHEGLCLLSHTGHHGLSKKYLFLFVYFARIFIVEVNRIIES